MVTIYAIEDINDLIYVGSTKQKLHQRLTGHRASKKYNKCVSSSKLNLDYCIIYELEKCEKEDKAEREKYWINKLDCVNTYRFNFDYHKYHSNQEYKNKCKEWYQKHKEEMKFVATAEYCKNYDYREKYRQKKVLPKISSNIAY